MDIGVELSLYPLDADFIPPIRDFIDRLNTHRDLKIVTSSLSTQVFGPYDRVWSALHAEMRPALAGPGKAVFVMKVIGPYAE